MIKRENWRKTMSPMSKKDLKEMKKMFLDEASENLSLLEKQIQILENEVDPTLPLIEIYRLIHSFKGLSGMAGVVEFEKFFHTYEGLIRCTTIKPLKIFINFYEDINESQTLNKAGVSMNTLVDHKLLVRFNNQYDENITIRIFSLSGTCVALFNTLITPSRTLEVDLSNLNSSIYIVKFENGNQVIYSGKIVKQ